MINPVVSGAHRHEPRAGSVETASVLWAVLWDSRGF